MASTEALGIFRGRKTLSVMPTYTCPAECTHCGTLSSPWDRTNLGLDIILEAIDQAKALGFYNVVFTGGEATLRWKDLLTGLTYAHNLGFSTRLVTNAHWAWSEARAAQWIDELVKAGLSEINFSTGDEHMRFVPLERVITAAKAALMKKLTVLIVVEYKKVRSVTKETILQDQKIASLPEDCKSRFQVIESPWMPLDPQQLEEYPGDTSANQENLLLRDGCDNVLQTYTLQADGRIGACCGLGLREIPELNVGTANNRDFLKQAIEDAENDLIKLLIHYKGPEKILAWAAQKDPTIQWENMYGHRCQVCHRIYKDARVVDIIREHCHEMMGEVLQTIWLDEIFIPEQLGDKELPSLVNFVG